MDHADFAALPYAYKLSLASAAAHKLPRSARLVEVLTDLDHRSYALVRLLDDPAADYVTYLIAFNHSERLPSRQVYFDAGHYGHTLKTGVEDLLRRARYA